VSDCPFCDHGNRELAYDGELVVAFRDAFPVSPGHTLVIPRRHVATYFEAGAMEKAELWRVVDEVKAALDEELRPDGYNIGINAGQAAGQTVMHLHIHVIPRFKGDIDDPRGGVRGVIPSKQKYDTAQVPSGPPEAKASVGVFSELPTFVHGEDDHLVHALREGLKRANEADFLSAFIQQSGLRLILLDIEDAARRGATLRILTGDYLGVTNADALRALLTLSEKHENVAAALFHTTGASSFHPKAYLFRAGSDGAAYVGSSNLSATALQQGVEWNLKLASDDPETFNRVSQQFEQLWSSPQTQRLTPDVISAYEARAPVPTPAAPEPREAPPEPHSVQREALAELKKTRAEGHKRGLVVLATGLGKTYLSAFDFLATRGRRALFIAHREEILEQAQQTWARVCPDRQMGIYGGGRHERDADVLFASVQTISRRRHLSTFAPDHFDYIVIDEFHHAAASTYQKVLAHFEPDFLLGLTATPDRLDGRSLLELCDDNLVFRRDLLHGITQKLLVPFKYYGVKDTIDFAPIPWRSGRFDAEALTAAVATQQRAEAALREYRAHASQLPRRTLVFCCSTSHADFMANYLSEQGVPAAAVHSGPTSAPRADSLRSFRAGDLEALCAVDVFNEGLDVPDVNTVLMLRPTESPIVFLQQLGRGLRQSDDKSHLTVVDFIGNHRSFLQKPQALVYLTGEDIPAYAALRRIKEGSLELPEGCSVEIETEAVDMLAQLARVSSEDRLIFEYVSLRDAHGRRPSASELFGAQVQLKPIRDRYESFFDFVRQQGDLSDDEGRVLDRHAAWFRDLLTTKMTKSYKMLALQALVERDELFTGTSVEANAKQALSVARRFMLLYRELKQDEGRGSFSPDAVKKWEQMPLKVWADGKSTHQPWFTLTEGRWTPTFVVEEEDRATFEEMTAELVDVRLREHAEKLRKKEVVDAEEAPIVMTVSHSSNKPILRFDRRRRPDIPDQETEVEVDGERYLFRFVKIAVNVVVEEPGGPNVLPRLMRQWFGPSAGLPGTRHRVELTRDGDRWLLSPQRDEAGAEVIALPRLPHYPELRVACGAFFKPDRLSDASTSMAVKTEHAIDEDRHFTVQVSGDSMDGGETPIRDGDYVLCEWVAAGQEGAIEGQPHLLLATEADGSSSAALKVPVKKDGAWWLRSWNPSFEDQPVAAGAKLDPVARVIGKVETSVGLVLWGKYNRDAIAAAFGSVNNPSWRVGHRDIDVAGAHHTVLMVTLQKPPDTKPEHRYADAFVSREQFQWESQASTAVDSAKGRRIIGHRKEGRAVHLFVRYASKGDDYTYCGRLSYQRHEGEKPIRVWWELVERLPEGLWRLWRG
jgi:superfamily II DNA or RNA helicase/diadenosine tetraphosphate (Ap4A) HIT family hydrolase/HKD family nuclease